MKTFLAALLLLAGTLTAFAQTSSVPTLLSYQGHVTDASGTPIGNASPVNRTVTFKFYSVSSGGTPLYAETQTVTISGGDFSVLIGNGTGVSGLRGPSAPALTPFTVLSSIFTGNVYLGLTVDDGTAAADPEITPRQQIVSSAYSFRAKVAEALADAALTTTMLADTAVSTNKIGAAQVTTAKIANNAVTTALVADGNITNGKLASGAVTTAKIADGNVTTAKIADGNVTTEKLAAGAVTGATIADGTITSVDIADGTIAAVDLAANSVSTPKIVTNAVDYSKLEPGVQQSLCPTGTIVPFAGDTAPPGWVLCDGTALNRTSFANLFAVIGTRFGYTDGTNFRVPDFRGRFLRGRDGGAGRDPDRNSRVAMNANGSTGDRVGSVQGDQLAAHNHGYKDIYYSESGGNSTAYNNSIGSNKTDWDNEGYELNRTTDNTGGTETRPQNASVNYIIKV
ncbi:tail fiber protein [Horticoccus luteus]|uniref:Tail fiber protein n=1 Tax=Horticoccus luteus TaxID=2862869 RepID=A0A8F9TUD9_9BACT|nr:tail fiber protein [Horticoccus luteus]QYM77958.1 tail fiber protein [Horticoccus luteus]